MSVEGLAAAANVGVGTLSSFEAGATNPTPNSLRSIRRALEHAGIEILSEGVRLKARVSAPK
jgi:transcriptional regulator with XRE-family HTH domain